MYVFISHNKVDHQVTESMSTEVSLGLDPSSLISEWLWVNELISFRHTIDYIIWVKTTLCSATSHTS